MEMPPEHHANPSITHHYTLPCDTEHSQCGSRRREAGQGETHSHVHEVARALRSKPLPQRPDHVYELVVLNGAMALLPSFLELRLWDDGVKLHAAEAPTQNRNA